MVSNYSADPIIYSRVVTNIISALVARDANLSISNRSLHHIFSGALPEKRNLPSALEGKSTSWVQATRDVLEGWK